MILFFINAKYEVLWNKKMLKIIKFILLLHSFFQSIYQIPYTYFIFPTLVNIQLKI